jgi:type IX secretion system PorP/SprF family membrane protein
MKKIALLLFFFGWLLSQVSHGQQSLYSQYFSTPLSLNPSLTGYFNGSFRFSSVNRSQWGEDGNPFKSLTASVEKRFLSNSTKGKLGAGLLFSTDNSNLTAYSVTKAALSVAYNKALDEEGTIEFGAGFQGQYNQRRINPFILTFESQFETGGFNTSIPTPEMAKAATMNYLSLNAGVLLNIKSLEGKQLYLGLAAYNGNRPKTNFMDLNYQEPIRWNIQAGGTIPLTSGSLHFSNIVSLQQGSSEILLGMVGSFNLNEDAEGNKFLLGSWVRLKDALIPYVGINWNGIQVAFSYDITTSSARTTTNNRSSIEFSLGYQLWKRDKGEISCPVF